MHATRQSLARNAIPAVHDGLNARSIDPDIRALGSMGPFPRTPMTHPLERRWLHYAFFSMDNRLSMIANVATIGPDENTQAHDTAVLLLHDRDTGWSASQWNTETPDFPWSSFSSPPPSSKDPNRPVDFCMTAAKGAPAVNLWFNRTSTPCSSQCATFGEDHFMRWQSEPGMLAEGFWNTGVGSLKRLKAVGYHERVRGRWGWPEMGGWVFGFCNDLSHCKTDAPAWSIVFTLLQPNDEHDDYAASIMVWKDGRLVRHIPRRNISVTVAGQLDRNRVATVPFLATLLGTFPTAPIPAALCIQGAQGHDIVELRFLSREAARIVIPSETSFRPFSVHEVVGDMEIEMELEGRLHTFNGPAVVEFAGGAIQNSANVY
ncbi:MAG: hypothetical protein GY847_34520 [Proteobacteria bacterium]|nr:hypothetical protein [Pseudomonadota bacterium]